MSDFSAQASITLDDASLNAMAERIGRAVSEGVAGIAGELNKKFALIASEFAKKMASGDASKKMREAADSLGSAYKDAGFEAERAGKKQEQLIRDAEALERTLKAVSKIKYVDPELFKLASQNIEKLQRLAFETSKTDFSNPAARKQIEAEFAALRRTSLDSLKVITRVSDQAATEARQGFQRQTDAANAAAREKNTLLRAAGEKEVVLTRATERQKLVELEKGRGLAITNRQAMWAALLRIESAGLDATQTLLKAGVSGLGKIWDSTLGRIGSTVKQHYSVIRNTTSSSLEKTETLTRSSLRAQERLYATSLSRQEKLITSFQRRASTGITGAITGRGLGSGIAAIGGGIGVAKLISDGYKEARDSIEAANKAQVIFGDAFAGIEELGKNSAQALGLTKSQAVEAAASFGNLLRPLGATGGQAAFLSAGLTQLGADLASFNNTSLEEALTAIRAGLVGENEPLRRFGVQINEATLKAKALELGLYSGKGNLDAYAKSQSAIALIYEQTSLAQGDFARTSGEVANQARIAGANLKNLFGALLKNVLPVAKVGFTALNVVMQNLTKFINGEVDGALKVLRDGLIGAAAGLAALLAAKAGVEVVQLLGTSLKALTSPLGLLAAAFALTGAAISILYKNSAEFRDLVAPLVKRIGEIRDSLSGLIDAGMKKAADFLEKTLVPALLSFTTFIVNTAIPAIRRFVEKMVQMAAGPVAAVVRFYQARVVPAFHKATEVIRDLAEKGIAVAQRAWERFGPRVIEIANGVVSAVAKVGETIGSLAANNKAGLAGAIGAAALATAVLGPIGGVLAAGAGLFIFTFRDKIVSGLKGIGEVITSFFKNLDWKGMGLAALELVETIGFTIGKIVSSPQFLTAVAAIAAAAVVVGAKFIEGFVKGVISNLPALASLGSKIAKALLDAITSNLLLSVGLISAAIFGPKLFSSLKTRLVTGIAGMKTSAKGAFSAVFQNVISPTDFLTGIRKSIAAAGITRGLGGSLTDSFRASFQQAGKNLGISTGQQIGVGIAAGVGSALAGQALGKGDLVGGLGGIIASTLAASAAGGPYVGAAVAGVGLVTAAFTANGERAKAAAAKVRDFTDAIVASGDAGRDATFKKNFDDLGKSAVEALDKAGFSLSQLSQAAEGNRAPLEETIRLVAKAIDGDYGGGASKAFTFLREQLDGAASGAEGAEAKLSILSRSTDKVGLSFGSAATLAKGLYAPLKSALDLAQSETRAKAVADAALEATNAYNALVLANAELVKFLNPAAGTFSAEVTKLISQLPGIGSQVQSGFDLGGAIGQADIDNALAGFDTTLADLVQKGVEAGLSADEIKKAIAALPIPELQITDEAKKALNQDIADLVLSDKIDIVVESNKTKLVADAKATAAKYGAVILGEKGNLKDAGAQLTAGLTEGMRAGAAKVAAAATAIARQAQAAFKSAMQISSPSKVFVGYGENIGQGLVLGIEAFMPKIGQVATDLGGSIGSAAADGIRRSTEEASAALGEFIDKLNSDISSAQLDAIKGSLLGGQTLDMARTGIGSDLAGIIDAGKAIADSIKEGKGGSFGFSGLEGLGNRQDVFGVVSEIKDLAETLFDVGTPIGDIVNELSFMREALLSTASAAGFNRTELEGLIDSLGLSQGAINSLASATADAQRQVVDAAAAEKAKADALAQADANAQATQDAERGNATTIINNIAIPYGDLEAVALAVSNRQASAASRRIRR